jgi:nucleoside-diphosphate kinase
LIGEIIRRFEARGYKLVGLKMVYPTEDMAKEHYSDLSSKPFYPGLCKYFSSGPIVAMVWEGKDVILQGRKLVGATNPNDSEAGSIRGDLCISVGRNIIHGSDGPDSAKTEISMWFDPKEISEYSSALESWIYER